MTAKQKLERNRVYVRKYVQKMAAQGWRKYCFLLPEDVAKEFYDLKNKRLPTSKSQQVINDY